jgi:hypothetical protein
MYIEKQKLPNATLILVLGILSIVLSCCCYGILGLIIAVITIVLAHKATKLYRKDPDQYTHYDQVSTGKILAIVGIVLGVAFLGYLIYILSTGGIEAIQQMQQEWIQRYGG